MLPFKSVIIISNKFSDFLSTSGEPSVNRIDLPALTLAGPTWHKPVLGPLAVRHLENRLYMELGLLTAKI